MKSLLGATLALMVAFMLNACANTKGALDIGETLHQNPTALNGDYSGKDFSGSVAFVPDDYDIPGVPESNGQKARWSELDRAQALHIDARCQESLFALLPDWAQALVREGGWESLAIAVGEGGFAAAFPGAEIARFVLGGLGYGFAAGVNTGRYRQDTSEKASQGYCTTIKTFRAQERYQILSGWDAIPWYGNGHTTLPPASDPDTKKPLPYVQGKYPAPILP